MVLSASKRLELETKFDEVSKANDRKLNYEEMKELLLKGDPDMKEEEIKAVYEKVDTNNSGSVGFHEFVAFLYNEKPCYEKAPSEAVKKFTKSAGKEQTMDVKEFSKFCKDCGLMDKGFTEDGVAASVAKVLPRAVLKITLNVGADGFSHYDKLLSLMAEDSKVEHGDVCKMITGDAKPEETGEKADAKGDEKKEGEEKAEAKGDEKKEGEEKAEAKGDEKKEGEEKAEAKGDEKKDDEKKGDEAKEGDEAKKEGDEKAEAKGEEKKEGEDAKDAEDKGAAEKVEAKADAAPEKEAEEPKKDA